VAAFQGAIQILVVAAAEVQLLEKLLHRVDIVKQPQSTPESFTRETRRRALDDMLEALRGMPEAYRQALIEPPLPEPPAEMVPETPEEEQIRHWKRLQQGDPLPGRPHPSLRQ
jgi:hypothetical protein